MACCIAQPLSAQRSPCETKCGTIFRACSVRRSPHQQQRSQPARPWVLQRQERSTAAPVCLATGFSQPAGEQESKLPQSRDEAVSREHPPLLLLPLLLSPPRLVHSTSGMPPSAPPMHCADPAGGGSYCSAAGRQRRRQGQGLCRLQLRQAERGCACVGDWCSCHAAASAGHLGGAAQTAAAAVCDSQLRRGRRGGQQQRWQRRAGRQFAAVCGRWNRPGRLPAHRGALLHAGAFFLEPLLHGTLMPGMGDAGNCLVRPCTHALPCSCALPAARCHDAAAGLLAGPGRGGAECGLEHGAGASGAGARAPGRTACCAPSALAPLCSTLVCTFHCAGGLHQVL